ncbi:2-C-methyl-D-erythritol 4-phosphate cytidylyltransferase, partial [Streptococcus pneumoniae]|nr:2-C-methyl-D-erythritol 4-phosphate cytidylyltransferase [Streptococcus pneumoniae]
RELIEAYVERYRIKKVKGYATGGAERQDSVRAGLEMAAGQCEVVLVHDAARPFISPIVIRELVEQANESGAAIAGVPVKDT